MGLQLYFNSKKKDKEDKKEKNYPGFWSRVFSSLISKIILYVIAFTLLIFFFDEIIAVIQWLVFRMF